MLLSVPQPRDVDLKAQDIIKAGTNVDRFPNHIGLLGRLLQGLAKQGTVHSGKTGDNIVIDAPL
eukprot:NODE_441_length_2081_cov_6.734252_g353_i0.p12 GENE.NODE_441_length_2081_cov_6.734252_g353_i0~~NODE_441_length_2081_cov_6.734252_g353_i0.p12  ORF type:complete len:64 (-),score=9.87 NODE_441_length_2081_cov_6.734252_g353_i0:1031-1222(-)